MEVAHACAHVARDQRARHAARVQLSAQLLAARHHAHALQRLGLHLRDRCAGSKAVGRRENWIFIWREIKDSLNPAWRTAAGS
eukprot:3763-Chlamydomonas_euryale.AAC.1